mgnify:CR=1 FL=1
MKKTLCRFIIIIIFITIINIISRPIAAQTATSSPTPKVTSEQKEIDTIEKIKDLITSRSAELNLVDSRGILGTVKRIKNSQIVIEDHKRDQRSIDIDELTKFVSSKASFGISDIKEGDKISAIGRYNKDTKRLLARFIALAANVPVDIEGVVTSKNTREFSLSIADASGKPKTIDVGTSTKTNLWDGSSLTKSGFSKILVGERVVVVGFPDLKSKNTINASRIIHFTDLPLSENLKKHKKIDEEAPVSTGSGVKVQPLSR